METFDTLHQQVMIVMKTSKSGTVRGTVGADNTPLSVSTSPTWKMCQILLKYEICTSTCCCLWPPSSLQSQCKWNVQFVKKVSDTPSHFSCLNITFCCPVSLFGIIRSGFCQTALADILQWRSHSHIEVKYSCCNYEKAGGWVGCYNYISPRYTIL